MPRKVSYRSRQVLAIFTTLLLVGACAFAEEALGPSVAGESSTAQQQGAASETQAVEAEGSGTTGAPQATQGGPTLGTGTFESPGVTGAASTGTLVGQKVAELREDLARLQSQLTQHNNQLQGLRVSARQFAGNYHSLIGAMNARLQVGTTPGNPELVAQWNQAQTELQQVGASIASLNTLSSEVNSTSALASFLLESERATFELRGAVEEDHRQLAILEDEVNKTVVIIERLLNELTNDIARTQNYFATERMNLTAMQIAIDNGEYIGGSLASRAFGAAAPPPQGGAVSLVGQRQPLVVVRFDRPNVEYEQALFTVVSSALERRPNAGFDIVAVSPSVGNSAQVALETSKARRHAEGVLRSLTAMGLPADRMTLAATSSPQAQVNEVHVYVR